MDPEERTLLIAKAEMLLTCLSLVHEQLKHYPENEGLREVFRTLRTSGLANKAATHWDDWWGEEEHMIWAALDMQEVLWGAEAQRTLQPTQHERPSGDIDSSLNPDQEKQIRKMLRWLDSEQGDGPTTS